MKLVREWRAMAAVADDHAKRKSEEEGRPEEALYHLGEASALRTCANALEFIEAMRQVDARKDRRKPREDVPAAPRAGSTNHPSTSDHAPPEDPSKRG